MLHAITQNLIIVMQSRIHSMIMLTFSPLLSLSCADKPFDEGYLEYETFHKCYQVPVIIYNHGMMCDDA